ncbi:hypothetical protein H0H81_005096 [Sphagnurus paluster]|uniref:Xylanolytic transcriptional activator regulatory domain-containing protein n=1 Tax=Sphagnurus paluster TaxID=117069 RepID=A0A9P7GSK8_9AGAR|nr:hypothetical protein H0H81_005096 [Sphagnurus paluster]
MHRDMRKEASAQRAQDKESKRARGQGTRFVLADTEKLHQKIAAMSDRIRQLEDALAVLQLTQTRDTHPLLHRDLLKIKSSIELHAAVDGEDAAGPQQQEEDTEESQAIDAFGTLAIRDDGAATFFGRSAGSESLLIGEATSPPPPTRSHSHTPDSSPWNSAETDLPPNIRALASAFPFGASTTSADGVEIDVTHLAQYLPTWLEAVRLCQLYMEQAPWFFGAVTQRQLAEELLPLWYAEAPRPVIPPVLVPTAGSSTNPAGALEAPPQTAHDLALLFILLCFGALTDISRPPPPDNPEAAAYYGLTKAALALAPVLERPPAVATVQTLALMAIYEGLAGGENAIEGTWAIMGLCTKLAQSVGLHRDCARWKLPPAEVQKRRALFWELFITDCWQSLATGRLATFSLPFVDCELPFDPDQTMTDEGVVQPSFPYWKARFGAECVAAVVQGTLTSRAPRYSIILELDRKVRDMELPAYAQGEPPQGLGLAQTMSHFMPTNYRELTLLYIHRCFFAHAIASNPQDPIKSQYAPSFLAGYRSACTILASVKRQFSIFPAQIARFWVLWTHAFSATVMLSSVVTHASQSKVASAAFFELTMACELFQQASDYGGRSRKFLPIIQRLRMKAQQTLSDTTRGIPPSIPNDIFRPSPGNDEKDELSIFSGRTHTVATKVQPSGSRTRTTAGSSRAPSDSPQAVFAMENPSFAGAHPSLVSELYQFNEQIAARLGDAYHTGGEVFARPMENTRERQQVVQGAQQQQQQVTMRDQAERERQQQGLYQEQMLHQQQIQQQRIEAEQRQLREQREQVQQQQRMQTQRHLAQQQQVQLEQQRQLQQQQQHRYVEIHPEHYQQPAAEPQNSHFDTQYQPAGTHRNAAPLPERPVVIPEPQIRLPLHSVVHSQSMSSLHQAYMQDSRTQQEQELQRPHRSQQAPAQQHSMYTIPPEYRQQYQHESPESMISPQSTTSSQFSGREQAFSGHHSTHGHPAEVKMYPQQYWAPQDTGYATHHYTPEGALKGIAADDSSLQETWQSYMYKVGSPRHLFED